MSLKQSIVVKSEYTIQNKTTGKGSRGSSIDNFIYDYMARKGCSDVIYPLPDNSQEVVLNEQTDNKYDSDEELDAYVNRYMARESAVEKIRKDTDDEEIFYNVDNADGVAFSNDSISLSDAELKKLADDIQKAFLKGKTVKKTVLSFDEDYLKSRGIVDKDLVIEEKGAYKSAYDQAKLRNAITHGMKRLVGKSKTTKWVAVIQNDTKHLHCHLCIVDTGKGIIMEDGTQKGKISQKDLSLLRRGVDAYLDEKQTVAALTADIQADTMQIKSLVVNALLKNDNEKLDEFKSKVFLESLMCLLPKNRSKWSANSNSKEMKKANLLVGDAVDKVLQSSDKYKVLLSKLDAYGEYRREAEDLDDDMVVSLKKSGIAKIKTKCINSVYTECKAMLKSAKAVTPTDFIKTLASDNGALTTETEINLMNLRKKKSFRDKYKKDLDKFYKLKQANILNNLEDTPFGEYVTFEYNFAKMLLGKYNRFISPLLDSHYLSMYERMLTTDDDLERDYLMANLAFKFIAGKFVRGYANPLSEVRFLDLYKLSFNFDLVPIDDLSKFGEMAMLRYSIYSNSCDYFRQTHSDMDLMLNTDVIEMYNYFKNINDKKKIDNSVVYSTKFNADSIEIPDVRLDDITKNNLDNDLE